MRRRLLVCLAVLAPAAVAGEPAAFKEQLATAEQLRQLRDGGYVLYIRHGETDNSRADDVQPDLNDCRTQRVLNDNGRSTMRQIGQRLRLHGIPVQEVLFSPLCRARESAELAFPDVPRRGEHDLMYSANFTSEQKKPLLVTVRRLISTPPRAGTNTVLVAHAPNLADLFGYFVNPEGTVVILRPRGAGQFDYVASIPPAHWAALALKP